MPPTSLIPETGSSDTAVLERELVVAGQRLAESLSGIIARLPGPPTQPVQLARVTKLGKDVCHRLMQALAADDPMALLHKLPGPAPLRRLLDRARRLKVEPAALSRAEEAVDAFEQLLRREAGDRHSLDAIISSWLPEARRQVETTSKQAIYRGFTQLKGVAARMMYELAVLHPSQQSDRVDCVFLQTYRALRRQRARTMVKIASRLLSAPEEHSESLKLDGSPIESFADLIIPEYTTADASTFTIERVDENEYYLLHDQSLGLSSAFDLTLSKMIRRGMRRYGRLEKRLRSGPFCEINIPTRTFIFDVLVHEDVYPEASPQLFIYDTAFQGVANVNDRRRDFDRLSLDEGVSYLGRGVDALRVPEMPRHVQMLRHVFDQCKLKPSAFRAYRCRIEYPVYGSQVAIVFDRPINAAQD